MQRREARGPRQIRLLIVDDVPDTSKNIEKLLHFEQDIQVVGTATSGRDAIAMARQLRPTVVLMDINLRGDMDGLHATEAIMREVRTSVVMMSAQGQPEYMARAMVVGARGFLIKPFTGDDLVNSIRTAARVVEEAPPPAAAAPAAALGQIVTVYSPKGGVGRTVLAANMAIALKAVSGKRVALVDAHLQSGDVHIVLNISTNMSIDDLREASALDSEMIEGTMAIHEGSGISVLRAPLTPDAAENFNSEVMRAILVELRDHFDYLVIDTDSTFSDATLTSLELADQILVVTTLEITTINRVSQFFEVAERLGYPRDKLHLICNRVDGYFGIKPSQVEARLRSHFMAQIPEDSRLLVTSVNRGVPFVLAQKAAPVSQAIYRLAQRVHENSTPSPAGANGRERRLFGLR